jgi:hypothetical protein
VLWLVDCQRTKVNDVLNVKSVNDVLNVVIYPIARMGAKVKH